MHHPHRSSLRAWTCLAVGLLAVAGCPGTPVEDSDSGAPQDAGLADTAVVDTAAPVDSASPADTGAVDGTAGWDAAAADAGMGADSAVVVDAAGAQDAALADAGAVVEDPGATGPHAVTTSAWSVTRGSRTTEITVYAPDLALPRGVLAFAAGFQLGVSRYSVLLEHLASHGFLVLACDLVQGLDADHVAMALDLDAVLDAAFAAGGPAAGLSAPRGVLGHSLGGKVAVMAAFRAGDVAAVLAIDPVNGAGNGDYTATRPDIVPAEVQGLTMPLGFAGETVNASGGLGGQACAPAEQNFQTFYAAATASSAAYQWDFAGADHMDFVDDTSWCLACAACTAGSADPDQVHADLRVLAAAFFLRHLAGQGAQESYLSGAGVPAAVTAQRRP